MAKLGEKKKIKNTPLVSGKTIQPKKETVKSGTFINLPVDVLKPNPYQPRQVWDEEALQELAESIKVNGVLHSLSVFKKEGQYYIAAGERRLRASKMAGLKTVPCLITTGNPAEIGLLENLQREDLRPIEEALAYERMQKEFSYTQEQLAKIVGKSKSIVSETLSLLKLPKEIKEEIRRVEHSKPKRELIKIARLKDPEEQKKAFFNKPKKKIEKEEATNQDKVNKHIDSIIKEIKKLSKIFQNISIPEKELHKFEKALKNFSSATQKHFGGKDEK
ncbi:MAG: ParB/RepB/Spo0J family partition protein [Desulfobacterales bacterium]|nr:ParB/RepB/Spo0J family partition protein [Desulfobacterales bacterium]